MHACLLDANKGYLCSYLPTTRLWFLIVFVHLPMQIQYSEMLSRVEPLKNELHALEVEANENRKKNEETQNLIANLEKSIGRYKEEYAVLISQAQAIKADLASVETKVTGNYLFSIWECMGSSQETWLVEWSDWKCGTKALERFLTV